MSQHFIQAGCNLPIQLGGRPWPGLKLSTYRVYVQSANHYTTVGPWILHCYLSKLRRIRFIRNPTNTDKVTLLLKKKEEERNLRDRMVLWLSFNKSTKLSYGSSLVEIYHRGKFLQHLLVRFTASHIACRLSCLVSSRPQNPTMLIEMAVRVRYFHNRHRSLYQSFEWQTLSESTLLCPE